MAAPTFHAASTQQTSTGASVNVSWPVGHQADDIGILVVETAGNDEAFPAPAGWETITPAIVDVASTAGSRLGVFWRRATSGSESSVSTGAGTNHIIAAIYTFRGCETEGSPVDHFASSVKTSASTTATAPAVTTTVADALIVMVTGRPDDSASTTHFGVPTNGALTGLAEAGEAGTVSGHGGGFQVAYGTKPTAGATGTSSITKSASTTDTYIVFALAPPQTLPTRTAPTVDARSQQSVMSADAATHSWNHTIGGGSNRLLIVGVGYRIAASGSNLTATYNGVAMTALDTERTDVGAAAVRLFYLTEADLPAAGTYAVEISWGLKWHAGAISFSGVDQTAPFNKVRVKEHNATSAAPNPGLTINGITGEHIVDVECHYNANPVTMDALTGRTEIANAVTTGGTAVTQVGAAMSDIAADGTAHPLSWTPATPPLYEWASMAVRVQGVESAGGTPQELEGTIASASTISGQIRTGKRVGGSVVAASSASGQIRVGRRVGGSVAATSVVSASLTTGRRIGGSVVAASTLSGIATVTRRIAASVASTSALAAGIGIRRSLAGLIASVSLVSAQTAVGRTLGGSVESVSVVTGEITVGRRVGGSVAATSAVTADLSMDNSRQLSGAIASISSVDASITVGRTLDGSVVSISVMAVQATVSRLLTGDVASTSSVTAAATVTRNLAGSVVAISAVTVDLGAGITLAGSVASTTTLSATVVVSRTLAATITSTSDVSAILSLARTLAGSVVSESVLSGSLSIGEVFENPPYGTVGEVDDSRYRVHGTSGDYAADITESAYTARIT